MQKIIYLFVWLISFTLVSCKTLLPELPTLHNLYKQSPIKSHTLTNGVRLLIKEERTSPVVAISILISVGSASEGERLGTGITHLLEHIIFKGTKEFPPGEIERTIKSYGGEINGFTTHDYTGYKIVVPKEGLGAVLNITKEMLTVPSFDKNEIEKEKEVVLREIDLGEDEPGRRINNLLWQTAYIRHPYRVPVIGYRELVKNVSREDLIEFFNQHYGAQNIIVCIVGDIEEEILYPTLKDLFGEIPRRQSLPNFREEEPFQLGTRTSKEEADLEGAYLKIGFHSTSILDQDLFAMDLLATILAMGENSRLENRLVREERLAYSISSYNYTPRDRGLFVIEAVLNENFIDKAIDSILDEINKIKTKGLKSEELIEAKNSLVSDYIFSKERLEDQADDLAINTLLTGIPDFSAIYIERIKTTDIKDIKSVANKYLTNENMTVAILRPKKDNADLRRFSDETSANIRVKERAFQSYKLKNGLDVLFLEDHRLPVIWLHLLFKGGVRAENETNNGVCRLLSKMLLKGTRKRTAQEIAKELDSKGGHINTFSENNSLGISLRILKENKVFAFELLSDILQNSEFPEEELKIEKTKQLGAIDMQDDLIFNQANRLLKETLFLSHPYRFQNIGKRETVEGITRKFLFEFYHTIISSENCVLAIAGDFEKDQDRGLIERYFEGWSDKSYKEIHISQETPLQDVRILRKEVSKKEAIILLGFSGISVYNSERFALEVLLGIISGGGGRLYQRLREENALAYAVGANSFLGIDPGYILIYALTAPENIENAKEIFFKEIEDLLKETPSEEELMRTKKYLKGMFWSRNQPSSDLLFTSSLDQLYGLGFENYKRYPEEIDKISGEDVLRVANKYLNLERYAMVILIPEN